MELLLTRFFALIGLVVFINIVGKTIKKLWSGRGQSEGNIPFSYGNGRNFGEKSYNKNSKK